ncbi:hypothetical protein QQA42_07505 [Cutibacterium acnes]|nr:hypothetical protein [Cutibacterium acnes]WIF40920.1 hypothetical protein QQA41_04095 [Cutibacterium acnes]WIF41844.1 hypothetical protein QQA42_07505 [Cutibacterium acnes]
MRWKFVVAERSSATSNEVRDPDKYSVICAMAQEMMSPLRRACDVESGGGDGSVLTKTSRLSP